MAESPRKRQRISDESRERMDSTLPDANDNGPVPTTPSRRASYLSPTKASLARSHPDVLAKSPKKGSLTEPRGRLLRQELLGSKKEQDNMNDRSIPKTAPRPARTSGTNDIGPNPLAASDKEGFAEAIARSFQDVVPRRSPEKDEPPQTIRSPLHTRQAPGRLTGKRIRNDKEESLSIDSLPVPKLIKKSGASVRQKSINVDEPELPPTPVQLGVGLAPDRPRGLASSSSAGSKSGSGKHRRRVRVGDRTAVISSPLKPKHQGELALPPVSDTGGLETEAGDRASENDIEGLEMPKNNHHAQIAQEDEDQSPLIIRDKELELSRIQSELLKLQQDLTRLGRLADDLQKDSIPIIPDSVLRLLQTMNDPQPLNLQSPDAHPSFVKDPPAYLKLFEPANLSFTHKTLATTVKRKPHLVHELKISATPRWPTDALRLDFNVDVNADSSSIQKVSQTKDGSLNPHERLQRWIDDRLSSDLHKFDIGGIMWGAGQYFTACVSRAKSFRALDERLNNEAGALLLSPETTRSEEMLLFPYLQKSELKFSSTSAAVSASTADSSPLVQILLTYDIELTWTGDVRSKVDISLAGIPGKAQKSAKDLFARLLGSEGVVGAFELVYDLLKHGEIEEEVAPLKRSVVRSKKVSTVL